MIGATLSTDPNLPEEDVLLAPTSEQGRVSGVVAGRVVAGTSALGAGIFIERAAGFAANILAARFAGAPTFGAYSLVISTANNISTYAAGGIGATATRFSGKYGYLTPAYSTLARALMVVSLISAALAAAALWVGAAPIAHLLHKTSLTGLLRWASISAAGIILLECARGFFVGQRRLAAVVLLSVLTGAGMLLFLPWTASSHHAERMIVTQGAITLTAVTSCLVLAKPLGLVAPRHPAHSPSLAPMLREIWGFGGVQLAGLVGANLSGWWLTALVARSDTTLVQMSFFAIASQLRNLVGLAPGLLTEGSYAVMADPTHEHPRTPHRVMALCTFASTSVALLLAAAGIVIVPWGLRHMYGRTYEGAALTVAAGLATAVVHMGNAPAAARLSIVSIRATGVINTIWAVAVAVAATLLVLHGGSAALAMSIFFGAHVLAASLVLITLARKDHLPKGMPTLFLTSSAVALLLLVFSAVRARASTSLAAICTVAIPFASAGVLLQLGRRHDWLPTRAAMNEMRGRLSASLRRVSRTSIGRPFHGI